MTEKKKTEVNLEMCSGFFRIPTDDIIYNITVLASNEPSTTKVVEKIIEVEKIVEVERQSPRPVTEAPPAVAVTPPAPPADDYFHQSAHLLQQELTTVAREAAHGVAGRGGPDLDAIRDLAAMASDLKEILLAMKGHPLLHKPGSGTPAAAVDLGQLAARIGEALTLSGEGSPLPPRPSAPPATTTVTRYLFNLDAVFQTIYELCTNETVKSHIQAARAKADEIFAKEIFYDAISPKVSGYPEDDGFLTVPMTDIYTALSAACQEKAINNLLAKMDKQQAAIFLDQFLPLEVPPREEVTISRAEDADLLGVPAPPTSGDGSRLTTLLSECQADLASLLEQGASPGADQSPDGDDLRTKVEDAITITASIHYEASRLSEEGALAQEGGAEETLGLRIKGLALLAETLLSEKEASPTLTYDAGRAAGEAARQRAVSQAAPKAKSPPPPPPKEPPPKKPPAQENFGEASQDDIDRLLEELG